MTTYPRKNFTILKDKLFIGSFFNSWSQRFTWKFKKKHLGTWQIDENGFIKNSLFIYCYGDSGATPHPKLWLRERYLFKDA